MPQDSRISVTAETQQYLQHKSDLLKRKKAELSEELKSLAHEEKDELGNQPYREVKRELDFVKGQIEELDTLLALTRIVECPSGDVVAVGTKARIEMYRQGQDKSEELELVIDGVCECGRSNVQVVTPESPIGAVLIGATVGEEREYSTPRGDAVRIVVTSICGV